MKTNFFSFFFLSSSIILFNVSIVTTFDSCVCKLFKLNTCKFKYRYDENKEIETRADASLKIIAQITYPYYVETPTHYALFSTSKRYDRDLCLAGKNDEIGSESQYYSRKLDSITLYKKNDIGVPISGSVPGIDVPIKEIEFEYLHNGADEYITKPFRGFEISMVVERAYWRLLSQSNRVAREAE